MEAGGGTKPTGRRRKVSNRKCSFTIGFNPAFSKLTLEKYFSDLQRKRGVQNICENISSAAQRRTRLQCKAFTRITSPEPVLCSRVIYEGMQVWDNSENMPVSIQGAQRHITPLSDFPDVHSQQHKMGTLDRQVADLDLDAELQFGDGKSDPI